MKHIITTVFCLILYLTSATAQIIGTSTHGNGGTEHPYGINSIISEENLIIINSDSLINDAQIIIKDHTGNIIYNDTMTLQPTPNMIHLPEEYGNEKYIIEIFYDGEHIIGRFEE